MHHVVAYSASLGSVTDNDTAGVTDNIIPILNGHFVFPTDRLLLAAAAVGLNLARARLSSPTMRQVGFPHIQPLNVGAGVPNNPAILDLSGNPYKIRGNEEVAAQISTTAIGPAQHRVILVVASARTPAPIGDIYTLRVTGGTAAVANTWTATALTFQDQLPVGTYGIVGAIGYSASMDAFRLVLDNQYERPGGLGQLAEGSRPPVAQMLGGWGLWGQFRTNSLPRAEVLCTAADATQEFFFQVVKMSDHF